MSSLIETRGPLDTLVSILKDYPLEFVNYEVTHDDNSYSSSYIFKSENGLVKVCVTYGTLTNSYTIEYNSSLNCKLVIPVEMLDDYSFLESLVNILKRFEFRNLA